MADVKNTMLAVRALSREEQENLVELSDKVTRKAVELADAAFSSVARGVRDEATVLLGAASAAGLKGAEVTEERVAHESESATLVAFVALTRALLFRLGRAHPDVAMVLITVAEEVSERMVTQGEVAERAAGTLAAESGGSLFAQRKGEG